MGRYETEFKNMDAFIKAVKKMPDKAIDKATKDVQEIAIEAMQDMEKFVMSRGTGYVGKGPRADPAGRIDYGNMFDDVAVKVIRSKTSVVAKWGWGINGESVPDYYLYQEYGTGRIKPMHALFDSFVRAKTKIKKRFK